MASTWRQRDTLPKYANFFPELGDQKRDTMVWPKRDTVTGVLRMIEGPENME